MNSKHDVGGDVSKSDKPPRRRLAERVPWPVCILFRVIGITLGVFFLLPFAAASLALLDQIVRADFLDFSVTGIQALLSLAISTAFFGLAAVFRRTQAKSQVGRYAFRGILSICSSGIISILIFAMISPAIPWGDRLIVDDWELDLENSSTRFGWAKIRAGSFTFAANGIGVLKYDVEIDGRHDERTLYFHWQLFRKNGEPSELKLTYGPREERVSVTVAIRFEGDNQFSFSDWETYDPRVFRRATKHGRPGKTT
jgi:hypothetical protein